MLTTLSRLGADCYLLTALGKDATGEKIKEILHSDGIKTDLILEIENAKSTSATIIVNASNHTRTAMFDPSIKYTIDIPFTEESISKFNWIHFDGRFHLPEVKIAEIAKKRGIPISVEAERLGLKADEHFKNAKIVFTSENFPNDFFGNDIDLETCQKRILALGPEIVITTLGSEGCLICTKNGFLKVRSVF